MISFVYFDLGGVVIKDFSGTNKWEQLKEELGINPDQDKEFDRFWDQSEAEASIGRDVETFVPILKDKFHSNLKPEYSLLIDGFVNRFEKNQSIWPIIYAARKKYPIGLLTNMYPGMFDAIKNRGLMPDVNWDAIIDSSVVGLQKPDRKIYEIAQEKLNFGKSEVFFVDNTQVNLDAAREFGWQTFLYDSSHPHPASQQLLQILDLTTRQV